MPIPSINLGWETVMLCLLRLVGDLVYYSLSYSTRSWRVRCGLNCTSGGRRSRRSRRPLCWAGGGRGPPLSGPGGAALTFAGRPESEVRPAGRADSQPAITVTAGAAAGPPHRRDGAGVRGAVPGTGTGVRGTGPGTGTGVRGTGPGTGTGVRGTGPGTGAGVRGAGPGTGTGVRGAGPGTGTGVRGADPWTGTDVRLTTATAGPGYEYVFQC